MELDFYSYVFKFEFYLTDKEDVWYIIRICLLIYILICNKIEIKFFFYKERLF